MEQGFQPTLDDNPRLQHIKGFNSRLEKSIAKNEQIYRYSTEQGQIGTIAPTATRTQGPADTGQEGDCWQLNTKGELVRVHGQYRKTLFTPSRTQRPAPAEQLEDYRRTTIKFKHGTTNTFEEKHQPMEEPNKAQQQMWKGETAFRIKKGTTLPETLQQQFATKTHPKTAPQKLTLQVIQYNPRTPTNNTGQAQLDITTFRSTSWARLQLCIPEQSHYEPDIKRLIPGDRPRYNQLEIGKKMNGQQSKLKHKTSPGQAGQTLRNNRSFLHSSNQMMKDNNKERKRKQRKHPSNQHHRRYSRTT